MYAAAEKIYPREVRGRYQTWRNLAVVALLGVFYLLPWVRWEGRQAVLFDLPARKFHVFALTFWPQDLYYLTALLITAALSLFFFTAVAGRLWCGYACPQTVWTEIFIWMERWTEGKRHQRMKLDRGPWTAKKIRRKGAKQFLWITFSLFTGFTFVGYFTPVTELAAEVGTLSLGGWETFWLLFYGGATYANAGFMREQVCKYMCPYARFQSAMFDHDTLIIAYDEKRGEPRGGRRRSVEPAAAGLGDCIDCTKCVQVCPTGIDIREGLQYECIACAACIDVCNEVMDGMGYERGLVRYTTENAVAGGPVRVVRPRTIVYAALLAVVVSLTTVSLANRTPLRFDVIRDRNSLYRVVNENAIENVYSLRIMNMDNRDHRLAIEVIEPAGLTVETEPASVEVAAGAVEAVAARIRASAGAMSGSTPIRLKIGSLDDSEIAVEEPARFIAPSR